jgi:excisionase family DNA binding protein
MERLFYSTGQAARQLGTTLAAIRVLCENRVIAAETTPGGHWRVSASEVDRLKRDGLPPIPRALPCDSGPQAKNGTANRHDQTEYLPEPSDEVLFAADQVALSRNMLEKRKIDRELEENEDFFRERQRQQAAADQAERQRSEAKRAEQQRLHWVKRWTQHALDSLPYGARGEVEMEVHAAVQEALSALQPSQLDSVTRRLVDAAVHRALAPWTKKQEIERALKVSIAKLPIDVQYRSEYAPLKQRAWDAAVAAVGRLRREASYSEIEAAVVHAVQPMIREYEHEQACQVMVKRAYIYNATRAEEEAAGEAVHRALVALPIGVAQKQLEAAAEIALAPYKAAVANRKEQARLESEKEAQRRAVAWKADRQLDHIGRYLDQEYEFDDGYWGRCREVERLRPLIREALVDKLVENPKMSDDEIREYIENQVDDDA